MQGKEIGRALTQDDVIGSSIFNRLVSQIISIEPIKDDDRTLLVKSMKAWFPKFMPFTYKLTDGTDNHTTMNVDLAPAAVDAVNQTKFNLWLHIVDTFKPNEWFKAPALQYENLSTRQIRRYLSAFVMGKKLRRRGEKKNTEYAVL